MAICLNCGETMRKCNCVEDLTVERVIEEEYRDIDNNIGISNLIQNCHK